jgi:hypothetical protein
MSTDTVITHAEALRLIDEHIGEKVYFGVLVARGDDQGDDPVPILDVVGKLGNPLEPKPPRLNPDDGLYRVGGHMGDWLRLAPMTGTVHLRDSGIDFRLADGVTVRVAWPGSNEVGDWGPTAESLGRLNSVGIRLPEHERPGVVLPSESAEKCDK